MTHTTRSPIARGERTSDGLLNFLFHPVNFPYMYFHDRDQVPISYTDGHIGEPVILLHGSLSSSRQWRMLRSARRTSSQSPAWKPEMAALARAGARCGGPNPDPEPLQFRWIALDLYGYGESGFPKITSSFRLDREVELVERLLDGVGTPAHLVGHSYGGAVALLAAVRRPELVRSVFVHEPVLFRLLRDCGRDAQWAEIEALSERFGRALSADRPDHAVELFVDYWSGPGTFAALPAKRRYEMVRAAGKVALDFEALYSAATSLEEFAAIPCPVQVTAGTTGPEPAREVARLLGNALREGAYRVIEGAGHMAPVTHPDEMNALILAHLRQRQTN